jgi:predicted phosphoadenosine phosphosulfate sulfurtransferase
MSSSGAAATVASGVHTRRYLGSNVFDQAVARLCELYERGHRLVLSLSGGKDSTVCLNLMLIAAEMTGRLPVDVVMRDEEIMYPGTFEYLERVAERPDVNFHWIYACQPIVNAFNRESPYWWVFDPELSPDQWVRQPPERAYRVMELDIQHMCTPTRFPVEGRELFSVIGLRVQESRARLYGLHSSGGYVTKPTKPFGVRLCRPIYDWTDGDVWKAISENGWDYNRCYDVLHRHGIRRERLRVGPPTMSPAGAPALRIAQQAWPRWFDQVSERCPGIRTVAQFGLRAVEPMRRAGETWKQTFERECVKEAPSWILARAELARAKIVSAHRHHSTKALPDHDPCYNCSTNLGCWRGLCRALYLGDPFSQKATFLPYVEPEFFRAGAGTWGGKPTF